MAGSVGRQRPRRSDGLSRVSVLQDFERDEERSANGGSESDGEENIGWSTVNLDEEKQQQDVRRGPGTMRVTPLPWGWGWGQTAALGPQPPVQKWGVPAPGHPEASGRHLVGGAWCPHRTRLWGGVTGSGWGDPCGLLIPSPCAAPSSLPLPPPSWMRSPS